MASAAMIAVFGFTALSVDLGNAWQNRRQLVNATDAAALAAAQEYAVHGNGCGSTATNYAAGNKADATITACVPSAGALAGDSSGHVMVSAEATVNYAFAPVIGVDSKTSSSTTAVRYGIPLAVGGLRPFGLCLDTFLDLPEWVAWVDRSVPSWPALIEYSKDSNPNACNGGDPVPGNWATMDLDGGGNSNADIQDWTLNGFPDLVYSGVPVPGDTGAFSPSLASELQYLVDEGIVFQLPLFDSATGNGSNASFNIVAFVSVVVTDFQTSGAQAGRSLTLQFVAAVAEGVCCDAFGIDTGTRVLQICAVDPTDLTACPVT